MNTTSLVFALWLKKDEECEQGSLDDDYDDGDAYDEDLEEEEGSQDDYKDDGDKDLEEVAFPLYKKDFWRTPNVE